MSLSTPSNLQSRRKRRRSLHRHIRDLVLFAMLGTVMFCSRIIMALLPNIHLLGLLIMVCTVVFRVKALIPLYIYVFLEGLYAGFNLWWYPYLYIWTILWLFTIILPKRMPDKVARVVYTAVCALHGLFYGILYAPFQALISGFNFQQTLAWIAAGISFDILHFIGNLFTGLLVLPFSKLMKRLYEKE